MSTTSYLPIPHELIAALRSARRVTVLTGAGISAESGLPTFREKLTGLWARYDPEDVATPEALHRDPGLVWDWFAEFRRAVAQARPNPAHRALMTMERHVPQLSLITQNIDGLHRRAGSSRVIELHGNIARALCKSEGRVVMDWEESGESPPRCPFCGHKLRPDVVLFGELLPERAFDAALAATYQCDLFLSIGTSGIVEPAASLPGWALDHGARVAVINLDVQPASSARVWKLRGRAGELLPALVAAAWPPADPQPSLAESHDSRFTTFYE